MRAIQCNERACPTPCCAAHSSGAASAEKGSCAAHSEAPTASKSQRARRCQHSKQPYAGHADSAHSSHSLHMCCREPCTACRHAHAWQAHAAQQQQQHSQTAPRGHMCCCPSCKGCLCVYKPNKTVNRAASPNDSPLGCAEAQLLRYKTDCSKDDKQAHTYVSQLTRQEQHTLRQYWLQDKKQLPQCPEFAWMRATSAAPPRAQWASKDKTAASSTKVWTVQK